MTLTIARGRGYVAAEGNKGPETTIGVIPVDSIFSPVRRVAYDVDPARVGQRTDFDKLKLEVTTNGSMTPKDAVKDAAEILIRYLSIFTDIDAADLALRPDGGAVEAAAPSAHGMENILIEELELGVRSYNCLKRVGIETIGDLISQERGRAGGDPELRQEVDRRGQGDAGRPRAQPEGLRVRHRRKGRKLGRDSSHRKALYSNMCGALFEHGRIRTTEAKAKELRPIAEKLITLARPDPSNVAAQRQAVAFLRSKDVVHNLFHTVGPRFTERPGGYTRIVKIGPRLGDAAPMVYIELVDHEPAAR